MREHPAVLRLTRRRWRVAAVFVAGVASLAVATGPRGSGPRAGVPALDHVVVVVFENRAYSQIIGSHSAPYINSLARGGANFTDFSAEAHPSQPNYFAMFSGSTQGVTSDACPPPGSPYRTANLAKEVTAAGRTWGSYNEGLPAEGSKVCTDRVARYARKHNPWFSFTNVPASTGHTFGKWPADFGTLPTVSFVIPDLCDDMHDCSVRHGDTWLRDKLGSYATWASTHNSLLVVTTDEDDNKGGNKIPTLFYGAHVKAGNYPDAHDHYSLLRTIEDMYGTGHAGESSSATPITEIWR